MLPARAQAPNPAIHADSSVIKAWAVSCELDRGPGLITCPDSIQVSHGVPEDATGKAGDGLVVSLGDGGSAILRFEQAIVDGPGADFAVFENSFDGAFLELGFVEVSSDGETFLRFPSRSLTPVDKQIGPYGTMDPGNVRNLAGIYMAGWGTGFDLAELEGLPGLDLNDIRAVRVLDVVGILDDSLGSRDAEGSLINDPFPTPFESGGFDLDGVGVIHSSSLSAALSTRAGSLKLYPLPCGPELFLEDPEGSFRYWMLLDLRGRKRRQGEVNGKRSRIDLSDIPDGTYFLRCESPDTRQTMQILKITR